MPTKTYKNRTFDARPDRVDLRDRLYEPKLISLPMRWPDEATIEQFLPDYAKSMILDQGQEGACTGFGLAAMVNFLQWRNNGYKTASLKMVSPRMLYHMARLYDEWPGEDYEGSSCRGAMKGWHRHGVCTEKLWPYRNKQKEVVFVEPNPKWAQDAASRPLGAYYRIDKDSINDLQSAIKEVGAIYCSADVHEGWFLKRSRSLPLIPFEKPDVVGGHAFALVGYTEDGFIVQNSWGTGWGYQGFAVMTYEDWVANAGDAWVAVMGAPMRVKTKPAPQSLSSVPLQTQSAIPNRLAGVGGVPGYRYKDARAVPWPEDRAYKHALVMGNNGLPLNRLLFLENAQKAAEFVCFSAPLDWLKAQPAPGPRKIALYAHGGLNNEEDAVRRIQVMAPYFLGNGIYPIFLIWRTGLVESICGILEDSLKDIFRKPPSLSLEHVIERIKDSLSEARDRGIEAACEHLLVKPVWTEMKQNAASAAFNDAGLALLAAYLQQLAQAVPGLELHLAGHSAGSILLGHLLPLLDPQLPIATTSLYAPACTTHFAVERYGAAFQSGQIAPEAVFVDIMDDERERADTVGPYGKSLLYLVSRALEIRHKTPLLGMQWSWKDAFPQDQWSGDMESQNALLAWRKLAKKATLRLHDRSRENVPTGVGTIKLSHGSFDNDLDVVSRTLERMHGGPLSVLVENLAY